MVNKEYAVFGLGKFGWSIAESLVELGCEVLVVDSDEEKIQAIADTVTYAIKGDITDKAVFESMGLRNLDGVIVAISDNLEASIMATILSKEAGIPFILAKAHNNIHATVLERVGADRIIFPEKEMGVRMARNLVSGNFIDLIELSSQFSMAEMKAPDSWIGKSLKELDLRNKYGINIIGAKRGDKVNINMNPEKSIDKDLILIIVGDNDTLQKLQ